MNGKLLKKELTKLLAYDIIRPSAGPWSSNVVMVSKKDGGTRVCLDYRAINKIPKNINFKLPRQDEILSSLSGAHWFSSLDATKSFFSIEIREEDKEKTQFSTPFGSYCFNRMAMGLKSAVHE